jgi:hypothetical protein
MLRLLLVIGDGMEMGWRGVKWRVPTIDTGTLEYLAGLAAGSQAVAFNLEESISKSLTYFKARHQKKKRVGNNKRIACTDREKAKQQKPQNTPFSCDNSYNSSTLAAQR